MHQVDKAPIANYRTILGIRQIIIIIKKKEVWKTKQTYVACHKTIVSFRSCFYINHRWIPLPQIAKFRVNSTKISKIEIIVKNLNCISHDWIRSAIALREGESKTPIWQFIANWIYKTDALSKCKKQNSHFKTKPGSDAAISIGRNGKSDWIEQAQQQHTRQPNQSKMISTLLPLFGALLLCAWGS